MGVAAGGRLQHWHWGARLNPTDLGIWRPSLDRAFAPVGNDDTGLSFNTLLSEFPFSGSGDFHSPAVEVEHADGSAVLNLRYEAHRLMRGKPGLPGLPALYVETESEADTLEIDLLDETGGLRVTLSYTAFAVHDVIARSARVTNLGNQPCRLRRVLSANVDFGERRSWRWLHLSGAWARERHLHETALRPGVQAIESRCGASGHEHNPFFALRAPDAGEEHGEVFGFSLIYSGNFLGLVELDAMDTARAQIGLGTAGFSWQLEPGETFQTPEAALAFSDRGLGEMSRTYHRLYRTRLCRGRYRDRARPVLINNWEATYFDFDETRLIDLARRAKKTGVELFVLDDGWFGHRDDVHSSLGDWWPYPKKLPRGLVGLAEAIAREGMLFGLWLEPEMISPDSELYREHPDWCLHVAGRSRSLVRSQLVLDFSRPEVRDAILQCLIALLRSAPIRYVKWDANRNLTEIASDGRESARQGETLHRHILGLYAVLEKLTSTFPDVLFEGCSGGGGRFDPGLLHYMPQIWTSDNSDAISRLLIQYGTSLVYPFSAMAAHISAVPNHQVERTTPLRTRGLVAQTGAFGLELDLARCTDAELAEIARLVERHRQWQPLLATGNLYRLKSPFADSESAWMLVSDDQTEALVFHAVILAEANTPLMRLRLRGLRPDWQYRQKGSDLIQGGDALMAHGWLLAPGNDFSAEVRHLVRWQHGT
ncbi:alpha-galactosidase [Termitidicoccus mucosus]|uniref:alpha-galactosidase n=1 Tax=Termitidicoccus mucosus TaxID=1184151 RepID=UPI002FEE1BE9